MQLDRATLLEAYRRMATIRAFEGNRPIGTACLIWS